MPYELHVDGNEHIGNNRFRIDFRNTGKAGACFQVRSARSDEGPWIFTVEAGTRRARRTDTVRRGLN